MKPYDKYKITASVAKLCPPPINTMSVDELCSLWWVTKRSTNGLQLTTSGHTAFTMVGMEYTDKNIDLDEVATANLYFQLNKKIGCPFHIMPIEIKKSHLTVRLYDDRLANWIELVGGLSDYLRSIEPNYAHKN